MITKYRVIFNSDGTIKLEIEVNKFYSELENEFLKCYKFLLQII